MSIVSDKVINLKGMNLHTVETQKYKTNTIVLKMKAPLKKEDVTKRALLPHVLQSNSKKYPTTSILRSYLDELYGASFYIDLAKKGEYHIISFALEIANEKFLSDQTPLLKKAFEFLTEVIINPNIADNSFDKTTVESEKNSLKQRIQSIFDDKMKYSNYRLIEEMCKEEPYALNVHGQSEDVDSITPKSLYDYYQRVLKEDEIDLYVIGDVNSKDVTEIVGNLLSFEDRTPIKIDQDNSKKIVKVNEIIEEQDVKQGKLNIGYRTNIYYGEKDYYALQIFNGIFGGFSHSKLFINVREKESLAYYVASRLESHKGLMMVMSGIDKNNYNKAITIINEQMNEMTIGNFSDDEITQTKAVIKNQLLETVDTARGMIEILYHNVVSEQEISLDNWLAEMENVTKEDIIKVASKIEQDTVYFLTERGQ